MNRSLFSKIDRHDKAIFFLFVTYSLHILRNLSFILYFLLFIVSYFVVFVINSNIILNKKKKTDLLTALFFITFTLIPIFSLSNLTFTEFIIGFTRFIPTYVFLLTFIIIKPKKYSLYITIYHFFIFFTFISGLSIIIQFSLNYSFDFLADTGGREGFTRYASFLGSLTTFGTLGPYAIFTIVIFFDKNLSLKNQLLFVFVTIVIIVASILSLQKASIINLIIIFLFYTLLFLKPFTLILFIFSLLIFIPLFLFIFPNSFIVNTFLSLFEYTFFDEYSSFYIDLLNRITLYVRQFFYENEFSIFRVIWGFGFKASSGTLGLPNYTNFHNNYFEMFFSGGFFHILLYIVLLIRTFVESFKVLNKSKKNKVKIYSKYIMFSVIYFMINMLIGASTIYHPIGGSLIIILLFFVRSNYKNISKETYT